MKPARPAKSCNDDKRDGSAMEAIHGLIEPAAGGRAALEDLPLPLDSSPSTNLGWRRTIDLTARVEILLGI
jgi:hypothetical protein